MSKFQDLTGVVFDRLTVVERAPNQGTNVAWVCLCKCGQVKTILASNLRAASIRSCGCMLAESRVDANIRKAHPREAKVFVNMHSRCSNPKATYYSYYGGRGIKVCDRWSSFANFLADMGVVPPGMTLDRIDSDADYEPGNCRWATRTEQANNKRNNVRVEVNGRKYRIKELAAETGINFWTLYSRYERGHDILNGSASTLNADIFSGD